MKPGDVVRLKSGGAAMTVNRLIPPLSAVCQWFVGDTLHTDCFDQHQLEAAEPAEPERTAP